MARVEDFYPYRSADPLDTLGNKRPFESSTTAGTALLLPYSVRGIHLAGEFSEVRRTDSYSAGDELVILADGSYTPITITLPDTSTHTSKVYFIKKTDSSRNGITISGYNTSQTIDGEKTIILTLQYQYVTVISDGNNWFIIGGVNMRLDDLLAEIRDLLEEKLSLEKKVELHLHSITGEKITDKDVD